MALRFLGSLCNRSVGCDWSMVSTDTQADGIAISRVLSWRRTRQANRVAKPQEKPFVSNLLSVLPPKNATLARYSRQLRRLLLRWWWFWWGYSKTFYTVRLRPEIRPLTLLYTIFDRKGTPFLYLLLTTGTPFTNLEFRTLHPF